MPPVRPMFQEPGSYKDPGWNERWDNLRLAALCIGVQAYPGDAALGNTLRDVEAMYKEVNMLDGCRAAILKDPKSKNDIRATPILEAAEHQFARGCAAVLCRARRTGQ